MISEANNSPLITKKGLLLKNSTFCYKTTKDGIFKNKNSLHWYEWKKVI